MSTLKVNTIQSNTTSELDINSPLGTVPSLDVINSVTVGGNINAVGVITATTFNGNLNSTRLNIGTGASISSPATNVLALGTNNTEVIRIASTGAVGVGTNDPGSTKMMVYGNGNVLRLGDFTNTHDLRFTGPNNWDLQLDTTTDKFNIRRNSSTFSTIDSNGKIGVGVTAPKGAIHLVDSTYKCLVLSNTNNNSTSTGGVIAGDRYTKTNNPFVAFASWDGTSVRKAYVGGGGWNLPEATEIGLYTAATYDETSNAALERLKIDSSGRVTLPYQPAFQTVGTNYSQSGAAFSIIIPNVVVYNQGSHYNGSTGRFTAPVAGRYLFGFWGLSYPHNTEVNQIRGFVNGSATGQEVQFGGAAHLHINHSGSILLNLNANDIFDFRYYQSSGSAKAYGSQWNMWGYLVG